MELNYRLLLSKYSLRLFALLLIFQSLYFYKLLIGNEFNRNNIQNISQNLKSTQSYRKYVAISTSLEFEKDFYLFYLPMTCESWRRIGFEPIIILVLTEVNETFIDLNTFNYRSEINKNKLISANLSLLQLKVIEYLNRLQVKIFYLRSFKNYEAQIGMLARLFIGYISNDYITDDNDYIILGDTDLIPINLEYYDFEYKNDAITIWNAFCCKKFEHKKFLYREYPMSHIGMRKYMWKNILTYDSQFDVFFINRSFEIISVDRSSIVKLINHFFGQNQFVINSKMGKISL